MPFQRASVNGHSHLRSLADIRQGLETLQGAPSEPTEGVPVGVVEHLRLKVPERGKEVWLRAERETWDPWLRQQKGFVEREVLWDSAREEGVLLIHWASEDDWKAIPASAVAAVQTRFEAAARGWLGLSPQSENPFPLIFAGAIQRP
jgi:uncharacterized protein (TIGR03792 family)